AAYYQEILDKIGIKAEECLMIGNNAVDDMVAAETGMETYLLTNYLEKAKPEDVSKFHNGNQEDLKKMLYALPGVK
ncbi:hypothetical protein LJC58_08835, partial [Lachnospiraceae bacterium OttesenSCG-928-D06]|nr:hypothetical protein [Lachnospiraceae bacterium OttesenSCG-928-D06]